MAEEPSRVFGSGERGLPKLAVGLLERFAGHGWHRLICVGAFCLQGIERDRRACSQCNLCRGLADGSALVLKILIGRGALTVPENAAQFAAGCCWRLDYARSPERVDAPMMAMVAGVWGLLHAGGMGAQSRSATGVRTADAGNHWTRTRPRVAFLLWVRLSGGGAAILRSWSDGCTITINYLVDITFACSLA